MTRDAAPDLEAIKARLIRAGYPRPDGEPAEPEVRRTSREAQEARAELREHLVADVWALIDALEAQTRPPQ